MLTESGVSMVFQKRRRGYNTMANRRYRRVATKETNGAIIKEKTQHTAVATFAHFTHDAFCDAYAPVSIAASSFDAKASSTAVVFPPPASSSTICVSHVACRFVGVPFQVTAIWLPPKASASSCRGCVMSPMKWIRNSRACLRLARVRRPSLTRWVYRTCISKISVSSLFLSRVLHRTEKCGLYSP